jgi:hypothetical protein
VRVMQSGISVFVGPILVFAHFGIRAFWLFAHRITASKPFDESSNTAIFFGWRSPKLEATSWYISPAGFGS